MLPAVPPPVRPKGTGYGPDGFWPKERAVEAFKALLADKGIHAFSRWERELAKLQADPRYKVGGRGSWLGVWLGTCLVCCCGWRIAIGAQRCKPWQAASGLLALKDSRPDFCASSCTHAVCARQRAPRAV